MPTLRDLTVARPIATTAPAIARFTADPGRWLPPPARARGRDRWEVTLAVGELHRSVLLELSGVWRIGPAAWRSCAWRPEAEDHELVPGPAWLPAFKGSLGVVPRADGTELVLHGTYTPPFGRLGRVLDSAFMGWFARRTALALLDELATGLRAQPAWAA